MRDTHKKNQWKMKSKEKLMSRQTIMDFDCAKMTKKANKLANKCVHWSTPLKRLRKLCIYSRKKLAYMVNVHRTKKPTVTFPYFYSYFPERVTFHSCSRCIHSHIKD